MRAFAPKRKMLWLLRCSARADHKHNPKRQASGLPSDAYSEGMFLAAKIIGGAL